MIAGTATFFSHLLVSIASLIILVAVSCGASLRELFVAHIIMRPSGYMEIFGSKYDFI